MIKVVFDSHFEMKKKITLCAALLSALMSSCRDIESKPREEMIVAAIDVTVEDRQRTISLIGEIQARIRVQLSFRVSGRVTERFVDVGSRVSAGEILAKIDPVEQRADLEAATVALQAAESTLRFASTNFDRQKSLLVNGYTTRVSYEQAEQANSIAEAAHDAAIAQHFAAKDALSFTELRSNVDGVITARDIEVGQVAQTAKTAFVLAKDGARDAIFDVYESIFLEEPQRNDIALSLISDQSITAIGHVREIAPAIDLKSATARVKVMIDNPPQAMTLGSAVLGSAKWKPKQLVMLPWSALSSLGPKAAVWVIDPNTRQVRLREIEVESYESESIVVRSGLQSGDQVVTEGGKLLSPGQVVSRKERRL